MSHFKKRFGVIAIVGMCALVGATMIRMAYAATATTRIVFHGSECQPSVFSPNGNQAIGHSIFGVHNLSSTDDLVVDCPLTAPTTLLKRLAPTDFVAGVYDRSTTENVSCTLRAVFIDGSIQDLASAQSSGGGPSDNNIHRVEAAVTNFNGAEEMSLVVECTLPRAQSGAVSHVEYYEMFYAIN